MCGIAGYYQFNRNIKSVFLKEVADKLHSRGPDSEGYYFSDTVGLAHKRLKILDLSDKAAQPMIDKELGIVLVFNGEIYNFLELRKDLEKSYCFFSESDSEVILKAFHAWNLNFVHRLEGMFAFAIYEIHTGKLILGRDRLGIKPLYYSYSSKGFRFASILPALLKFQDIDTSLDEKALHYYLTFHAIPEPYTLIKGAKKLEPGSLLVIHKTGILKKIPYWSFNQAQKRNYDKETWIEITKKALEAAVDRQLNADVPVGILLSGGLDSSILVALAAEKTNDPLETFSIGFESIANESGDEFIYSDLIANKFKTKHHKIKIQNIQIEESLTECVDSMSEPMSSHDNIGFYLLSKEVAKFVKVVLSGQGADELFAGYHWFQTIHAKSKTYDDPAQAILDCIADFSYKEYCNLIHPDYKTKNYAHDYLTNLFKQHNSVSPLDNLVAYETGFSFSYGPLSRVDNMTMAASLEARVPFLDELVVSVAASLPNDYKLPQGGKYILKELAKPLLPNALINRPKGYFPVPLLKYIQGPIQKLIKDILNKKRLKDRGIYNISTVEHLLDPNNSSISATGGARLWQIAVLEYWLQRHLH